MIIANSDEGETGYRVVVRSGSGTHPIIRRGSALFKVLVEGRLAPFTFATIPVLAKDQPCIVEFFPPGAKTNSCSFHVRIAGTGSTAEAAPEEAEAEAMATLETEAALPPDQPIDVLVTFSRSGAGKAIASGYRQAARDLKT